MTYVLAILDSPRNQYAQRPNRTSSATHSRLEDLRCKLTQQPRPIGGREVQENLVDTFPLCVTNGTKAVTRDSTGNGTREVANDETHRAPTNTTNESPESPSRACSPATLSIILFSKTFLSQHLLKHGPELIAVAIIATTAEAKVGPREAPGRDFFFGLGLGLEGTSGVVVTTACGVREGVVGVVDVLEFPGAGWSLRGVGGDSIRVGLQ